jgi:hypothetical protein
LETNKPITLSLQMFFLFSLFFFFVSSHSSHTTKESVYIGGRFSSFNPLVTSLAEADTPDYYLQGPVPVFASGYLMDGIFNESDLDVMYVSGQFIHFQQV